MRCQQNCKTLFISILVHSLTTLYSRAVEREKQTLNAERERQKDVVRTIEHSLHSMELNERDLQNEIREKATLEERLEVMKTEILTFTGRLKVFRIKPFLSKLIRSFLRIWMSRSQRRVPQSKHSMQSV